jgi:hypothetical protein
MPAANAMSYAFLTRSTSDCAECGSQDLLEGISRETRLIKQWSMGLMFLDGLRFSTRIPGLVHLMSRRRRCMASLVLSNLGQLARNFPYQPGEDGPIRAGNVTLERVTGAPPVRRLTRVAMLATRNEGRLTLGVRCDPWQFSPGDAKTFLAQYVERLEKTAIL